MQPVTKLKVLVFLAVMTPCFSSGVLAEEAPREIRLGQPPPAAAQPDQAEVRAIERFLAARQSGSLDRSRDAARRFLVGGTKVDAATLVGERGETLAAFDFSDAAIVHLTSGRFRVPVYLLFTDGNGRVTRSRDEDLTFDGGRGGFACSSIKVRSSMSWDSEEITKSADRLHAREALDRADDFLRTWAKRQTRQVAYSISDIYPDVPARIVIPCLRFTAQLGKRGYDVVDMPLMMSNGPNGYQLEPAAN
jgi:hypothetical protein